MISTIFCIPCWATPELALEETPPNSTVSEYIREIVRATGRAKSLVSQILSFSRAENEKRKPIKPDQSHPGGPDPDPSNPSVWTSVFRRIFRIQPA